MKELLEFEADRRAISITINSFGTSLNDPHNRESERKALFCNFGTLYPETTMNAFTKVLSSNHRLRSQWINGMK
jgi:vacuolar-type H+-ATPase subunit C/Vma6